MYSFTKDTATELLEALENMGYGIDAGLTNDEIDAVEKAFGAPLPPDLNIFLQTGIIRNNPPAKVPKIISKPYYPDWRHPEEVAAKAQEWIEHHVFRFDIEKNGYWYKKFGDKPTNSAQAVQQALEIIRTWPPLFPIHGHRFIPSDPHNAGNPVLSVWQATDTAYYGMNLLEHMNMDFHLGLDLEKEPKKLVPYWGEAFDLDQVWQPLHPPS